MDFVTESPLPSPSDDGVVGGRRSEGESESFMAAELVERVVVGVITCVFAIGLRLSPNHLFSSLTPIDQRIGFYAGF